ncbi:MAG: GlsB/YeaQ/YmgE family stress response membrane protein [Actinomycetota bacterium]
MMGILGTILIGLVVGIIAKLIHPGRDDLGLIVTILLGIAGSLVAGFVGQAVGWYKPGETAGFIASVIGAVVLLVIYTRLRGRSVH